jgi:biotin transport system substrate-specific component
MVPRMTQNAMAATHPRTDRFGAAFRGAAAVAGASLLVGLAAQVAIPLPFTPVPLTLQTLVVLLVAAGLGARRAALAIALYIAEGAAGLPVFAAGRAGIAHLLGPTGGYLAGFLAAALVVGALAEAGWMRRPLSAAAALLAGTACIYLPGTLWLGAWVGPSRMLSLGLLPFLPGEAVKLAACLAAVAAGFSKRPSRAR